MKKPRPPRSGRQIAKRPEPKSAELDIERFLSGLPDEEAEDVRLALLQSVSFRGPLPPPALYEHYEEVLSGSADRILRMAEKEQDHRISWEQSELKAAA